MVCEKNMADTGRMFSDYFSFCFVRNPFSAVFPSDAPRYVVVTQLEDPVYRVDGEERRTAGWTVVQVAGQIIDRVGY
jgi:cell division protein FtsI/penicillin-binding protein 2